MFVILLVNQFSITNLVVCETSNPYNCKADKCKQDKCLECKDGYYAFKETKTK